MSADTRRRARIAAGLYAAYFILAILGQASASVALSVIGTVVYLGVAVGVYRCFASAGQRTGLVALAFAAVACVVQAAGQIGHDGALLRDALGVFGLFMATLGTVILRSGLTPRWLGIAWIVAGLASVSFLVPGLPSLIQAVVLALAGLTELSMLAWLLVKGFRG